MNPSSRIYKLKYELTPNYHKVKGRLVPLIWDKRNLHQPKLWLDRVNAMVISTMLALIPVSTLTLKIPEAPQHTTSDGIINPVHGNIQPAAKLHVKLPAVQSKLKPVYIPPKPKPKPVAVVRSAPAKATTGCGDNSYAHYIYMHESGCNTAAVNSLGCRGIGQACPGSKLPCGADYACQNNYFTSYALGRYGSWAGAYSWWLNHHWW